MSEKRILIIEDEAGIRMTLEDRLKAEGYSVQLCADGPSGEIAARTQVFDLILLDLMLPGRDGLEVCDNLRAARIDCPILMLTARAGPQDIVDGLRKGGDDYLAKPFDMNVLIARIEAILRRTKAPASPNSKSIRFGDFTLDEQSGELLHGREVVPLNAQEYRLLHFMASNPKRMLERGEILEKVWGYDDDMTTRTIDVHIAKLRHHLGENDAPRHIITFRGRGYKFVP